MDQVTELLRRWSCGDDQAMDELVPLVYQRLRVIARRTMRHERKGHTFSGTDLLQEAFVALCGERERTFVDRQHFFAIATRIMKQKVLHYAKYKNAKKRSGLSQVKVESLDEIPAIQVQFLADFQSALEGLEPVYPRHAQVAQLYYTLGLGVAEIAEHLRISSATVKRDLQFARAFLGDYLRKR